MRAGPLAVLLLSLLLACASRSPARPPPVTNEELASAAAMAMQAQAMAMMASVQSAEAECAALRDRSVPWSEELYVGSQLALSWGTSDGGYYLEPLPETDLKLLQHLSASKPGSLALPPGPKNDLTAYVQVVGAHLASHSRRPTIAWTFGVLDDPAPQAVSALGGFVFVTRGLLAVLQNEAQLAAVLAHEIAMVASPESLQNYAHLRHTACRTALTGLSLSSSGAAAVPGGEASVRNSKFARTMRTFASPQGLDFANDPEADSEFIAWYLSRMFEAQTVTGARLEAAEAADRDAFEMLGAAGYDSSALAAVLGLYAGPRHTERISALETLRQEGSFGAQHGKAPAFPKGVQFPR